MSKVIKILPPIVAERIAAGEIIERPSSVVKELVENSLDAKATQVLVRLEDGGKSLIEVIDNGKGMSHEDLEISIERHATSKLKTLDDLDRIATLGFRGEALPSITAVSDLTLISRSTSEDTEEVAAYELQVGDLAGRLLEKPKVHKITFGQFIDSPHGTQIQARGLFSQVPARLKFLKSQAAEVSQVREWLERLAMAYPHVGFQLISEEKTILKLNPEDEISRVKSLLADGEDFPILTATNEQDGVRDLGFKARIHWVHGLSSPNSRKLIQIVNSRAIRDRLLQQATLNPFKQALLPGQFPAVALFIEVQPAAIDVNVHPTKSEIRFLDSRKVFQTLDFLVKGLIKNQGTSKPFSNFDPQPNSYVSTGNSAPEFKQDFNPGFRTAPSPTLTAAESASPWKSAAQTRSESGQSWERQATSFRGETGATAFAPTAFSFPEAPLTPQPYPLTSGERATSSPLSGSRFVGILFLTYLAYEKGDELILIDQHAAHERIRYEALMKRFQGHTSGTSSPSVSSQALLVPESVHFPAEHRTLLEQRLTQIAPWGFDGEIFGEAIVLFRSVPAEWGHYQLKSRLKNLIDRLLDSSGGNWLLDENLFETLASEACHSAIRAGDPLENEEVSSLTRQLFECDHPWNCPHGRPTLVRVPRTKLEEWFQRKLSSAGNFDV